MGEGRAEINFRALPLVTTPLAGGIPGDRERERERLTRSPDDGRRGDGVAPAGLGAAAALELAEDVLHAVLADGERGLDVARRRLGVDQLGAVDALVDDAAAVTLEVDLERVRRPATEHGVLTPARNRLD